VKVKTNAFLAPALPQGTGRPKNQSGSRDGGAKNSSLYPEKNSGCPGRNQPIYSSLNHSVQ